jgi:undecaprenyl diphosphate synthase
MPLTHLAIILDGNRRWAREQNLPTLEGHRRGYENVKTIGLAAFKRGISHLSVFAFSTENWKRSEKEVSYLMDLLYSALTKELDFFLKHNIRLRVIGQQEGLRQNIVKAISMAEETTAHNRVGQLNLCINYGGRTEIVDAVKKILTQVPSLQDVTEESVSANMWTAGIPDVDLLIRTSGEQRLSGFLTWLSTYAELLFVQKHWPDFTEADLDAAIEDFHRRERRFGE